jgi:hypothetical protein
MGSKADRTQNELAWSAERRARHLSATDAETCSAAKHFVYLATGAGGPGPCSRQAIRKGRVFYGLAAASQGARGSKNHPFLRSRILR